MVLFNTDSLAVSCANLDAVKQWWIRTFGCKETNVPEDWDCALPSDLALRLPGDTEPTILLSDRAEVQHAGYDRPREHAILFTANVKKAYEHLSIKGANPGPIQEQRGPHFFEVLDPEGNIIEICEAT